MNKFFIAILGFLTFIGCKNESEDLYSNTLQSVVEDYATLVRANYEDALTDAESMQKTLQDFVDNPSELHFTEAKNAWLKARESYGQTEAFRFYGGPIDDADGPEGQLNAWPLDESYIDYVVGNSNGTDPADGSNIINSPKEFPTIDKAFIASRNENGSETNVSSGYHAIEFLLWGQDVSEGSGAGERPYTDYLTDGSGTNSNQDRRAEYLLAAAALLVEDLTALTLEWETSGSYWNSFTSDANGSLEKILNGIGKLSKGELAGERMFVAWDLRSKEDEHSCFSDNTHRDIVTNTLGINNVFFNSYTRIDGSQLKGQGVYDLLALKDAELANTLKSLLEESLSYAEEIQAPFDQEFLEDAGRVRIKNTIDALRLQGDKLAEAAAVFGFTLDPDDI